jgi:nitronate monooxygenase
MDLWTRPIVQAPMAGGPSGPGLVAAVSGAGGLGFLAAGYKTPQAVADEVKAVRAATPRPFGVNLFLPQPPAGDPAAVAGYAARLAPEAEAYGVATGDPDVAGGSGGPGADHYAEKLALLTADPVPVVSFTFGVPAAGELAALRRAGSYTVVTVTSVGEARVAEAAGADALCVQGVEAGAHQGTHVNDPARDGESRPLRELLAGVRAAVRLPLVAAGGLMSGADLAAVLDAGAVAGQFGTAFLATPESGANPLHKRALTDPRCTELTRAFSGRPARGLVNRFLTEHGPHAPAAYPDVHYVTAPLRKAAAARGDLDGMALWAGTGHRRARELPAAELVAVLAAELAAARGESTA